MVNPTQRLRILRSEIESAQRNAAAERALAATGAKDNPWKGAGEKCDELNQEARDLELEIKGEAIKEKTRTPAYVRQGTLQSDGGAYFCRSSPARRIRTCGSPKMDEGGHIARAIGCAYDLEAQFAPWYLSNRERFAGAPSCVDFFMKSTVSGLRFDEKDRPILFAGTLQKGQHRRRLFIGARLQNRAARYSGAS